MYKQANTSLSQRDLLHGYKYLRPNLNVRFHGFCFDEGTPYSMTCVNPWISNLQTFQLPREYHDIQMLETVITFGGKGKQNVEASIIGRVKIYVPLLGDSYLDNYSLVIINNIPVRFELTTQTYPITVTYKDSNASKAHLRLLNLKVSFYFEFNFLYYGTTCTHKLLSSSVERLKIHLNLSSLLLFPTTVPSGAFFRCKPVPATYKNCRKPKNVIDAHSSPSSTTATMSFCLVSACSISKWLPM